MFFAVPKTASQSVTKLLREGFGGEYHGNYHNVVIPADCLSYYKFCTVRHPYSRAVSLYFHIKNDSRHRCHRLATNESFESWLGWLTDVSKKPSFLFCENDLRRFQLKSQLEEEFFRSSVNLRFGRDLNQTEYLSYALAVNYITQIDMIIRYEELEEGFRQLPFAKGYEQMPVENVTKGKPSWRELLNPTTEALIYQWAKDDFESFGYERENFHENSSTMASQADESGSHSGGAGPLGEQVCSLGVSC